MATEEVDASLRLALAAIAAEDLPGVIEEARAGAREEVRKLLTGVMVDAMLAQTGKTPMPDEPVNPEPTATGLYAYCVTSADSHLPWVLDTVTLCERPMVIIHGRLAMVVSEVPLADFDEKNLHDCLTDPAWLERTARRHESVIETVARHTTPIPLRLCTVYRDNSRVIEVLAREGASLSEALAHLSGKAEWGVKVFGSYDLKPARDVDEADPAVASGTEYMRRRQMARDERLDQSQRLSDAVQRIHHHLAEFAADALTCPPQRPEVSGHSGPMLLNGAYLVPDTSRPTFLDQVERLQAEHLEDGLHLRATGPWPAYNFVPSTIGAVA